PSDATGSTASVSIGDATVNFSGVDQSALSGVGTGTDTILGQVSVAKDMVGSTPISINYDLKLGIDDHSNSAVASQGVDITGTLTGTITKTASGALAANLANTYSPSVYT